MLTAAEVLCKTGLVEARVMKTVFFQLPSIVGAEQLESFSHHGWLIGLHVTQMHASSLLFLNVTFTVETTFKQKVSVHQLVQ